MNGMIIENFKVFKFNEQILFVITLLLYTSIQLCAEERLSSDNLFSKSEKQTVLKGGIITKSFLKNNNTTHSPNTDAQINIPDTQYAGKDLADYEMICLEKAFFQYRLTEELKLPFYNILASASKLKGMEYYSKTESKTETLIISSSRIVSPDKRSQVNDTIYSTILPKTVSYFTITDNRFGELTFRSELYNEGENFILKNTCIDPMEKYFISINKKEEYQLITFFIYDKEAKGFFYCSINAMRIRSSYFLKLGMLSAENFANRIRGSTVHMAKLLGLDWSDKIKVIE
jgi:hypothetical protein